MGGLPGGWAVKGGTLTFDEWVVAKALTIAEARGVSVEDLATEPAELSKQLARCRQQFVAMGEVKADATSWVLKTHAVAIQEARKKYAGYSAKERSTMAESNDTYLRALRIREDVATTLAALKTMSFEIMNDRRTSFVPSAHNND